jgi:hypothetical protein
LGEKITKKKMDPMLGCSVFSVSAKVTFSYGKLFYALFGCLFSAVVLDIRDIQGPNTPNIIVWRVKQLELDIRARYQGPASNGQIFLGECRGKRLDIAQHWLAPAHTASLAPVPQRFARHLLSLLLSAHARKT